MNKKSIKHNVSLKYNLIYSSVVLLVVAVLLTVGVLNYIQFTRVEKGGEGEFTLCEVGVERDQQVRVTGENHFIFGYKLAARTYRIYVNGNLVSGPSKEDVYNKREILPDYEFREYCAKPVEKLAEYLFPEADANSMSFRLKNGINKTTPEFDQQVIDLVKAKSGGTHTAEFDGVVDPEAGLLAYVVYPTDKPKDKSVFFRTFNDMVLIKLKNDQPTISGKTPSNEVFATYKQTNYCHDDRNWVRKPLRLENLYATGEARVSVLEGGKWKVMKTVERGRFSLRCYNMIAEVDRYGYETLRLYSHGNEGDPVTIYREPYVAE